MKLVVAHKPMHSAWGKVDELEKPEAVVNQYALEEGLVHDLTEFKIRVKEVLENNVTLEIFDNNFVIDNEGLVNPNKESLVNLKLGNELFLYADVMDAMENWTITLEK